VEEEKRIKNLPLPAYFEIWVVCAMPIFSVQLLYLSRKENTCFFYEELKSLMQKEKGKKLNLYYCLPVLYMWNITSVYTSWLELFFNPCLSLHLGLLVALESAIWHCTRFNLYVDFH